MQQFDREITEPERHTVISEIQQLNIDIELISHLFALLIIKHNKTKVLLTFVLMDKKKLESCIQPIFAFQSLKTCQIESCR